MKSLLLVISIAACGLTGCSLMLDDLDANAPDDINQCVNETDEKFCENKSCGTVTDVDNCGKSRTVACKGSCFGAQICQASDANFECRCPSPPHLPAKAPAWPAISQDAPLADEVYDRISFPGEVLDKQTCLRWKIFPLGSTMEWTKYDYEGAKKACESLSGGWRLPTQAELDSIMDHYKAHESHRSGPTINTYAFPSTPEAWFWTSTDYVNAPCLYWTNTPCQSAVHGFDFNDGRDDWLDIANKTILVRCVR